MGTRYEDQPPEHWAGPGSLDPTPTWRQYLLVALLLVGGLVLIGIVSALALAPQLARPPVLVPGDRLVLSLDALPAIGAPPRRIGPPLVDEGRALWLSQPARGEVVAFRALWSPSAGVPECAVEVVGATVKTYRFVANCPRNALLAFDEHGAPQSDATRGLDRYLVSVASDRIVVNLSRLIRADERVVPSPTR